MLRNAGIYFINSSDADDFLSYAELYNAASTTLHSLQKEGVKPEDELVFQLDDNKSFVILFWACVLGGIIPVPLKVGNTNDHKQKVFEIWPLLNNPHLLSAQDTLNKLEIFAKSKSREELFSVIKSRALKETLISFSGKKETGTIYKTKEDSVAFIQFSSGSTGKPKGVILTHLNLITNITSIGLAAGYNERDAMLSWMPLSHDMGLIGFHLNPLFVGVNHYLIPTNLFIRRPEIWLNKATEHAITVTCSPNFGFSYVLKHCQFKDAYPWDLSAIRIIFNGAEPISEKIASEFSAKLASFGLKKSAMTPVYGLAEGTLAVSITDLEQELISLKLNRNSLKVGEAFVLATNDNHSVHFVNVGIPIQNCVVRVVDDHGKIVNNNTIGNIQIKGKSVTSGYYNNEQATKSTFTEDGWLNTGDLGLFCEGNLYVTGRSKDIIFVNGQNYYPHDIERLAEEIEGIELNKIIVAGKFNQEIGRDEIFAFVFFRDAIEKFTPLALNLKKLINKSLGFDFDFILPVRELPRTTSGKLQRFKLIEQFSEGLFDKLIATNSLIHSDRPDQSGSASLNKLIDICKRVLRLEHLDGTENFFEIGGNSLLGAEVLMILSKELQVEVSFDQLYECPDLHSFAKLIKTLPKSESEKIQLNSRPADMHLSSAQRRLYYLWEINKEKTAYNIPVALKLEGRLDPEKLESALNELVREHEILNVSFICDEEPKSLARPSTHHFIDRIDGHAHQVDDLLKALIQPFDLKKAPLFNLKLISTGPETFFLFLDFHHIIADGKSLYLFIEELFNRYHGKKRERSAAQFKDYIAWEAAHHLSPELNSQKHYWLEKLSGNLPLLDFPTDYNRPAVFDYSGKRENYLISADVLLQLKQVAQSANCSLHNLFFTVYTLLLYRYTGQRENIIGIPVSGRNHNDFLDMQGMFVNNLAIKSNIDIKQSFRDFLSIQKQNLNEALKNQEFLFSDLADQLNLKRDISRNPLFDTMFNYQNFGFPKVNHADFSVSYYPFDSGTSKFDLSLEILDFNDAMSYTIEYSTKLFSESTIKSVVNTFEDLLLQIIEKPEIQLSDLLALNAHQQQVLVYDFNDTTSPYDSDKSIIDYFEEQARMHPDRIAIDDQGQCMTYAWLNRRANFVAAQLQASGICRNDKCAVMLPRSSEYLISILAILKSGACFIPIDTDYPDERACYIIENSQCAFFIKLSGNSINSSKKWVEATPHHPVVIDIDDLELSGNTGVNPIVSRSSSDLAYIIYTSGTTGLPKGVMINNISLLNYTLWGEKYYLKDIGQASFPFYTSISFDLTITSIFLPLCTGNKIVIYKEDNEKMSLLQVLEDNKVNIMKLTPSHLKMFLDVSIADLVERLIVKKLIVGGENFEPLLADQINKLFSGNIEMFNEYGPTEATVGCMIHKYDQEADAHFISLGIPIANTQIYLLDHELRPVSIGVQGEICIAGEGLALGYLNNEALTEKSFIENPFVPGERMYKTGDLAKRFDNGRIVFLGRRDKQVKINGYRIELSEIEKLLSLHPSVKQSVVALVKNETGIAVLQAYYCTETAEKIGTDSLRLYLLEFLPHYMVPNIFVPVENIPLTINGKVDYDSLYEIKGINKENAHPELNEIETKMLGVWKDLFKNNGITTLDNYFELGGDSIKAVQIVSRLNTLGISLSVKDILSYQTVREIASRATFTTIINEYPQGIVHGNKKLSPIEFWFFSQKFTNPNYYNQSILLRLEEQTNPKLLEKAFQKLIDHHDGLRINYDKNKQELFYNAFRGERDFHLKEIQVKTEANPEINFIRTCEDLKKDFNITNSLLINAAILNHSVSERYLLITAHHLIIDGVSWRILLDDLYELYQSLVAGKPIRLPLKTASLINCADLLEKAVPLTHFEEERKYWQNVESIEFTLPSDMETDNWKVAQAKKIRGFLDQKETEFLIKESHKAYKTDLPILLNLALALAINKWTGKKDIIIEQENHGRDAKSVDVSRTIGWFTNMYPLHLRIEGQDLDQQIKLTKERIRSVPEKGANYGVFKLCDKDINDIKVVRTEVRLNYLGQFDHEFDNDIFSYDLRYTGFDSDPENHLTAKLDFNLMVVNGKMQIEITYNEACHQKETMEKIMSYFIFFLRDILAHIEKQAQVHFTPSDFELADLNQQEIDSLFE